MIIFFNNQPVTAEIKIKKLIDRAKDLYGSEFYNLQGVKWIGDQLTVDSLFPSWIIKEYNTSPTNVLIIPLFKNYLRWLFSLEYGYGAQLDWEHIRTPLYCNSLFLEALADFHFYKADFSQEPLKSILSNIRSFLIKPDTNYYNIKGTPSGIKYLICNLLGFKPEEIDVFTANAGVIEIDVLSSKFDELKVFDVFLKEHVIPAGISVIYGVK